MKNIALAILSVGMMYLCMIQADGKNSTDQKLYLFLVSFVAAIATFIV